MILRLDTPRVPRAIPTLRVARWHVAEGDAVAFGDLLVELRAEETLRRLRRPASLAGRGGRRARPHLVRDEATGDLLAHDPPQFGVEVRASEPAFLRRIVVPEGGSVVPGDRLAVLGTEPDEPDGPDTYPLRIVADVTRLDAGFLEDEL